MIPDDQVDEVRARSDIVDVIGEFVSLKKSGREFKANCPFHDERTPSFFVVPDKGFYKCFGCGKSGDVFSFLMEKQGMDFVEAVKHTAARAGVEIREVHQDRDEEDPNRPFYEINGFARGFFRERLVDPEGGKIARDYLAARGIDGETAERFGLGFAPDEWRAFREAAAKHGLDEDLMLELGLLGRSEKSPEAYDRFRRRIVFPIESLSGKVIAFGGRVLDGDRPDAPKYVNSPESPIYHKGLNLYGLSWARHAIRREECALVVEGYMDVVSLAAHGIEHVVAPLGTALTPEQASLLGRYSKRVVLLFDSDSAGLKATFRAGDVLLEAGLRPVVVTLPEGEDPDTVVRGEGPERLRAYIDHAVDVLDRKVQILDERDYFSSIERTRSAVDRLLPTLRAAADPALRDIYMKKVSEKTGVSRENLEGELSRERSGRAGAPSGAQNRPRPSERRSSGPPRGSLTPRLPRLGAERKLLQVMVRGVEWVERAAELVSAEDFDDPHHRAIFEVLLDDPDLRTPPSSMDPVTAKRFEEILSDQEELSHGIDLFTKSVNRLRVLALDRRIQELQRRIESARGDDEKLELANVKATLARELRQLDPNYWGSATRGPRRDHSQNEPSR
ncbi:MAG: DNA primase [Gemmatimonadota bacterium]